MKNVVIFGASRLGEIAYNILKNKYNIICFFDNDKKKWNKSFCNLKINPIDDICNKVETKIIIASIYYAEISVQLMNIGCKDINIFTYSDIDDNKYDKRYTIDKMNDLAIFKKLNISLLDESNFVNDFNLIYNKKEKIKNYLIPIDQNEKNILIVAYLFPPIGGSGVQRTCKFVQYLKKSNYNPIVVTSGENFQAFDFDYTLLKDVDNEIPILRFDHNIFSSEQLNKDSLDEVIKIICGIIDSKEMSNEFLEVIKKDNCINRNLIMEPDIYIGWVNEVLKNIEDYIDIKNIDVIFTTSGPYSDHIIGYYIKKKYPNIKWIADFRDEWTNNPYLNSNTSDFKYRLEHRMEECIIKNADKIIHVTPISRNNCMKIFNVDKEKVYTITNGYDEEDFNNLEKEANQKKFIVTYAGTMYYNRFPKSFILAFNELIDGKIIKDKENIEINFYGKFDWRIREKINQLDKYKLIKCHDYITHKECIHKNYNSNILFLPVGEGEKFKSVYTGKIFEYIRLNVPILALSPKNSVVEDVINKTNTGRNFQYNDIEGIKKFILRVYTSWQTGTKLMRVNKNEIVKYSRENLTKKLVDLFY